MSGRCRAPYLPPMPPQAPQALQQHIRGTKTGDEEVRVQIKRLLHHLRTDHDTALLPAPLRLRMEEGRPSILVPCPVYRGETGMQ